MHRILITMLLLIKVYYLLAFDVELSVRFFCDGGSATAPPTRRFPLNLALCRFTVNSILRRLLML